MILNYRSKITYYVGLLFILLMMYRNSWLPFGVKTLPGKEVYLIVFASLVLFVIIFDFRHLLNQDLIFHLNYNMIFAVLIVIFTISILLFNLQEITDSNNYRLRFFSQIFYFLLYFVIFPKFLFQNPTFFKKFIKFVTYLGNIIAITAVFFLFLGINPDGTYKFYAVSFIWHPNYTAFIFTVSIFATIYYYSRGNLSVVGKIFFVSSFVIQNIALFLTFCRAAVLGVCVGYAVFLFVKYRWKLVFLLPVVPVVVSFLLQKFFLAKGLGSTFSRFLLVLPAINMITDSLTRMLWGYGMTNSFEAFKEFRDDIGVVENVNNPHNAYLSAIMEFGAIFSVVFMIFLSYVLYKIFRRSLNTHDKYEKLYFSFLLSSITALLFHSIFDSQLLMPEFFCMQFFLIFFGLAHYYILEKRQIIGTVNLWKYW